VPQTLEAQEVLGNARLQAESIYAAAEARSDAVGTTVWGRVSEQTRKLALIHAVSETPQQPVIGREAAEWAVQLVTHQTQRMLYKASLHVSDSEFEQKCSRVIAFMREHPSHSTGAWIPYRDITRRFRWSRRDHEDVRNALLDQELIESTKTPSGGRSRIVYRLRG